MGRIELVLAAVLAFLAGMSIGVCLNRAAPTPAPAHLIAPVNLTRSPSPAANRDLQRPTLPWPASTAIRDAEGVTPAASAKSAASPWRPALATEHPSPSDSPRSVATQRPAAVTPPAAAGPSALRDAIAWCESRNDPTAQNPHSTASGLYGFLDSTWHAVTGLSGHARNYPAAVQTAAFDELYAQQGTRPWNASRACWEARLR